MATEGALPCSQNPANCPCPTSKINPVHTPPYFLKIYFNIVLPSAPTFSKLVFPSFFPTKVLMQSSLLPCLLYAALLYVFQMVSAPQVSPLFIFTIATEEKIISHGCKMKGNCIINSPVNIYRKVACKMLRYHLDLFTRQSLLSNFKSISQILRQI
jgi:hypothetical protein